MALNWVLYEVCRLVNLYILNGLPMSDDRSLVKVRRASQMTLPLMAMDHAALTAS
jgi:hypothetical protein